MCGRFGLSRPDKLDLRRFGIESFPSQPPRYNIAPGTDVLTVRVRHTGRVADILRWGLVPHWAKDPSIGNRMANVRADTALDKPGFRDAIQRRRCLLPADVFYEWRVVPNQKTKQPYAVARPDRDFFALGAIWDYWKPNDLDGEGIVSCAILTTEPNALLQPIHDRMPVIIPPAAYSAWLDSRTPEAELRRLVRPLPEDQLDAWPISTRVNRAAEEGADLLDPVA